MFIHTWSTHISGFGQRSVDIYAQNGAAVISLGGCFGCLVLCFSYFFEYHCMYLGALQCKETLSNVDAWAGVGNVPKSTRVSSRECCQGVIYVNSRKCLVATRHVSSGCRNALQGTPWIFAHRHLVSSCSLDELSMSESGARSLAATAVEKETWRWKEKNWC